MVDWTELVTMINVVAGMTGVMWHVLDDVVLYSDGVTTRSVLDGLLIGGWIFEFVWDILDELRT